MFRIVSIGGAVAALMVVMAAPVAADDHLVPVRQNPSLAPVPGAFAEVERSSKQVGIEVHDAGLLPSTRYDELWVVFNHPEACTHPTPASMCDPGSLDARNPATGFSVIPGSSFTSQASGRAEFETRLRVGDVAAVGGGLTDPRGAEVALLWRVHGTRPFVHIVLNDPAPGGEDGD